MAANLNVTEAKFDPYGYRQTHLYSVRKDASIGEYKRRLFQLFTDHQYTGIPLDLKNNKIILMCSKAGGFGDISQTLLSAEFVKKKYPNSPISIAISCFDYSKPEEVLKVFPSSFEIQFITPYDCSEKIEKVKEIKAQAGCALQIGVALDQSELRGEPFRLLREYGFSGHPDIKKNSLSMGLNPELEEGLLFPSLVSRSMTDLQTEWLKNTLSIRTEEEQKRYLKDRKLYHMYMPSHLWTLQMMALYSVADIEKQNQHAIDMFLPLGASLKELVEWGALQLDPLKKYGIGKLTCVSAEGTECIDLGVGKEMRVLKGTINQSDIETIEEHSQPYFGCTGDGSISKGIKRNKCVVYADPGHKSEFFKSLTTIAFQKGLKNFVELQNVLLNLATLEGKVYRENTPKTTGWWGVEPSYDLKDPSSVPRQSMATLTHELPKFAEQMAQLYLNTSLIEEAKTLDTFIVENYNVQSRLEAIVIRSLVLTNYPHLLDVEKGLWKKFKKGEMTEEQVVEQMSLSLKECRNLK